MRNTRLSGAAEPLYLPKVRTRLASFIVAGLLTINGSNSSAQDIALPAASQASALLTRYAELVTRLDQNQYRRPLYLESVENRSSVNGDAFGILNAPLESITTIFQSSQRWCDVMILHLNTKLCRATGATSPASITLNVGKKTFQSLDSTYELEFGMKQSFATSGYFSTALHADKGPLGTSDYRVELEAVPLPGGKTFMHLRYSYRFGMAGRLAMQSYLATLGSDKVGFTRAPEGTQPAYIGGMRGAVERNTMRYYLAIEAYVDSLKKPAGEQRASRLNYWFNATEQYALQLHEVDRDAYLSMKKAESQRQNSSTAGGDG